MFPYIAIPKITLGFATISIFNLMVILAVCVGFLIAWVRASPLGFNNRAKFWIISGVILSGFIVSHIVEIVLYNPEVLQYRPAELSRVWGTMSSYGGIMGGLLYAVIIMKYLGLPGNTQLRFIDCIVFAFPFAWSFGRLGCALTHDHLGINTNHWLAVQFPGGSRLDLGLLEFLYTLLIAILFLFLNSYKWHPGFFISLFFILYGPVRFIMDEFRTRDPRYFGLTPGQYGSIVLTFTGAYLMIYIIRQRINKPSA
ncbi:MAG TPA: prolipoprotein diacylglyceryl transferase family protein [bacterium]